MIRKKTRFIFSDMDNTLLDFRHARICGCQSVVDHIRVKTGVQVSCSQLFSYFHRGVYNIEDMRNIRDFLSALNIYSESFYEECAFVYETNKMKNVFMYPGALETIQTVRLSGISFIVVTDATLYHAEKRLKKTGLYDSIDDIISHDMTGYKKPSPEIFDFALKKHNALPDYSVFVGDSLYRDIAPAKKAGMTTAYAEYGTHCSEIRKQQEFVPEMSNDSIRPDWFLSSLSELLFYLGLFHE